jgi:hypothetical protein
MKAADVAAAHPEAVKLARDFREVFGEGVKLTYAKNKATGAELGKPLQSKCLVRPIPR